jgi:hypothetical protein
MATLRDERCLFSLRISQLVQWAHTQGWSLCFDEGRVFLQRVGTNSKGVDEAYQDRVHKNGSFHYSGLAMDLNLYVHGEYQSQDCPEWQAIGKYWNSLGPECTWGGSFMTKKTDLNHFSWKER